MKCLEAPLGISWTKHGGQALSASDGTQASCEKSDWWTFCTDDKQEDFSSRKKNERKRNGDDDDACDLERN